MKRIQRILLLQLSVITLMSVASSYAFLHTVTLYQINSICFYRYVAYFAALLLGYVCFASHRKLVGLTFASAMLAVALSPLGQQAVELFPLLVPLLTTLMGITTILIAPRSRGKGFFEYLVILVLPAVLAESRIGGSVRLIATAQSIGIYELSAVTVMLVGGYFYLRYAALTNVWRLGLLDSGGDKKDVTEIYRRSNAMALLVIIGASGIAALLMAATPTVADALRATVGSMPLFVLTLAVGCGMAITTLLYVFRLFQEANQGSASQR